MAKEKDVSSLQAAYLVLAVPVSVDIRRGRRRINRVILGMGFEELRLTVDLKPLKLCQNRRMDGCANALIESRGTSQLELTIGQDEGTSVGLWS